MNRLYKVLVLGGALVAGCGTVPEKSDPLVATEPETDGGTLVADAGRNADASSESDASTVADTGEEQSDADAGSGVCPWSMAPCPC